MNRRIYFIGGFDPRGAAHYYRLYKEELEKQSQLNMSMSTVGKRQRDSALFSSWRVSSLWDKKESHCEYIFLSWDDIVRKNWTTSIWLLMFKAFAMYRWHMRSNLLKRFKLAGRGPFLCVVLPLIYLSASAILAITLALCSASFIYSITDSWLFSALMFALVMMATYYLTVLAGIKTGIWWVLRTCLFLSSWGRDGNLELDARAEEFAAKIIADNKEFPVDEVLLIGHCVGSLLSISVMANILKKNHESLIDKLKFITLGQCIPYLSYQTSAIKFRQELTLVSKNENFPWLNVVARADPICFDQVNPAIYDNFNTVDIKWPKKYLIKPYEMYHPERYKKLKRNKFRIHFQYIMSSDLFNEYDYFKLTSGLQFAMINPNN